ncbi:hypothetical protein F0562_018200 [Nyssa sinensis]|uniref:phosphoribosylanthranilate isomerase n=1 Tax=Nyssa sinensis TaxID=561372 RepID=A0A5J4Z8I9_9ASTE|nr:hypothetical protein F0562_018200 [Nyssa sinensis]
MAEVKRSNSLIMFSRSSSVVTIMLLPIELVISEPEAAIVVRNLERRDIKVSYCENDVDCRRLLHLKISLLKDAPANTMPMLTFDIPHRFPSSLKASKRSKSEATPAKSSLAFGKLSPPEIDPPAQPQPEVDLPNYILLCECCELFLLRKLGSGKGFNWSQFKLPPVRSKHEWLLAGGINPENVCEALSTLRPHGVDVSSGICAPDGIQKDESRISSFMSAEELEQLEKMETPQLRARKQMGLLIHPGINGLRDHKIHQVAGAGYSDDSC